MQLLEMAREAEREGDNGALYDAIVDFMLLFQWVGIMLGNAGGYGIGLAADGISCRKLYSDAVKIAQYFWPYVALFSIEDLFTLLQLLHRIVGNNTDAIENVIDVMSLGDRIALRDVAWEKVELNGDILGLKIVDIVERMPSNDRYLDIARRY